MHASALPVLSAILLLGGCAATKGYPGPERPSGELSKIYFYSKNEVDLSEMTVDGSEQGTFDMGVAVLPGRHTAYAKYESKLPCIDLGKYGCIRQIAEGECGVNLTTEAGRSYGIEITGIMDDAMVRVYDEATNDQAGHAECRYLGQHVDYEER